MNTQEAYRVLQEASGIEVGDKVKVLRMPTTDSELGWDLGNSMCSCLRARKDFTDIVGSVERMSPPKPERGFKVRINKDGRFFYFPFFCLELIEKAKPEPPPIMIGDNEVKFLDGKIKVCGETISKETVRRIYERL